jgi:Bcr/CflA subfamily drug resistance transporter
MASYKIADNLLGFLVIILLISSLGQVMSDLYLPSLPAMAETLGVHTDWIQLTLTVYMLGYCLSQLIYGPFSDAIGRRPPVLFGLGLSLVGSVLCWESVSIYWLFIGRLLQGFGVGAGMALTYSILRDLFEKETLAKYNSFLSMSSVGILVLAPILGGYIQFYIGWRYNFVFLGTYTLFILIFFYYKMPETNQYSHQMHRTFKSIWSNIQQLCTSVHFLRFTLCTFCAYAGILAWLTAAPIVLQNIVGLNAVEFGWLYLFSGLGFAFGGFLNAKYVMKYGIEYLMKHGMAYQFLSGLLMLLFYLLGYINTYVIMVPVILFMFGSAFVFPNASARAFDPFAKIAGAAGGVFSFMQILGGVVSSSILSAVHDDNQLPMAIAFILTSLLSITIFTVFKTKIGDGTGQVGHDNL